MVKKEERLESYAWSSYQAYLQRPTKRPVWLRVDRLMGEHGVTRDNVRGRAEFSRRMEFQRAEAAPVELELIRRGWRLGSEEFLGRLLDRMDGKLSESHRAKERGESEEEKAERIIAAALKKEKTTEKKLKTERKGAPIKVRIARCLRSETTMTLKWIACRLEMGTWTHVSNLLYHQK